MFLKKDKNNFSKFIKNKNKDQLKMLALTSLWRQLLIMLTKDKYHNYLIEKITSKYYRELWKH